MDRLQMWTDKAANHGSYNKQKDIQENYLKKMTYEQKKLPDVKMLDFEMER